MRRNGFTLIELLLTIVVLAIGLSTLFLLLPSAARASADAREQRRMDRLAETVFASLQSGLGHIPVYDGTYVLDESGNPAFWPKGNTFDGSQPLSYTLTLTRIHPVREATLKVSSRRSLEEREYIMQFSESPPEYSQPEALQP
jgi:prepilin-type N-terminal cleavage/methylation domain-containing protein